MKKNGFTLIELIAAITILAVIALIAFPALVNMLDSGQKKVDDKIKLVLEGAAEEYVNDINSYPNTVSVCNLAKNGYITTTFFRKYEDNIGKASIKVEKKAKKYTYEFQETGGDETCDLGD